MGSRPASARVNNTKGDQRIDLANTAARAGFTSSFRTNTNAAGSRFINWSAWSGLLIVIALGVGFWFAVGFLIVRFVR